MKTNLIQQLNAELTELLALKEIAKNYINTNEEECQMFKNENYGNPNPTSASKNGYVKIPG